jgi:hypothetical protein
VGQGTSNEEKTNANRKEAGHDYPREADRHVGFYVGQITGM